MATKIRMRVKGANLEAVNQWEAALLEPYGEGTEVTATVTKRRSLKSNGYYWSGLQTAVDNMDEKLRSKYPTKEHLHRALLVSLGYVDTFWTFDGLPMISANSTKFNKMDEVGFGEYLNAAIPKLTGWLKYNPWTGEA